MKNTSFSDILSNMNKNKKVKGKGIGRIHTNAEIAQILTDIR
jgi:hypothetical protein